MRIIQMEFSDGLFSEELTWATMVLLPKGKEGYQGIWLVEATLKVCAVVINAILDKGVELHNVLHGFQEGWGMGTATLEAELGQQLAGLDHEPLLQVF